LPPRGTASRPAGPAPAPEGGAGEKGRSQDPRLKAFGRDLTEIARKGEMDPVIGRKNEIERVIQILCRRTKNNPVLSARPAWARPPSSKAWPRKSPRGNVPEILRDKRVITLDLA
jgi:ATP-dependent Clp protease ATP-binding subunit ClpC